MKNTEESPTYLTIVGGGPVGALMALVLAKKGYSVHLIEKRDDPATSVVPPGRSINLALSTRGLAALSQVGLNELLLDHAVAMNGRLVHDADGSTHFNPYSKKTGNVIYSISRILLGALLLEEVKNRPNITLRFNEECIGIDLKAKTLQFRNKKSGEHSNHPYTFLFDSEGIWSPIRAALLHAPYTDYSQQYLHYDYKELNIPLQSTLEFNAFHLWPRNSHLMIALPNKDRTFTCTLFLPHKGPHSFDNIYTPEAARKFLKEYYSDALALSPEMPQQLLDHPVGRLATVHIAPWTFNDEILLLGDAAHAIVPFYGQGLNCGLEDCALLSDWIDQYPGNWGKIFHAFEESRRKDTDAIATLSEDNFVELREKVADPVFRMKRELETRLEEKFPEVFLSKYSMVTFSRMPYAEALAKGRKQDAILMEICSKIETIDALDLDAVMKQIKT